MEKEKMMENPLALLTYNANMNSKRLTAEEEAELAIQVKAGDTTALDTLVNCNMGLVFKVASKYANVFKADKAEFVSAGCQGLIRAAKEFDPEKGRFSTCASLWIRKFVLEDYNMTHPFVIPQSYQRLYSKWVRPIMHSLEKEGIAPTPENIAALSEGNLDAETVSDILSAYGTSFSMDMEDEDGLTIGDRIADTDCTPSEYAKKKEIDEAFHEALNRLPEIEHGVILMRYGVDGGQKHTLKEVADVYNLSQERIRQIELSGKHHLANDARLASLM